jgi:hypothetical protein
MYYDEVSRSTQYMDRLYDIALHNPKITKELTDAYATAAINAMPVRYLAMFQVVIDDFKAEIKRLNPAANDYMVQVLATKRGAISSAELIASKLPQTTDFNLCVQAVKIRLNDLVEQAKQGGEA